jgi:hypothetical protein
MALQQAPTPTMPAIRPGSESLAPGVTPIAREIPYDYVAKFILKGKNSGNRVQDVINISIEGAFVAVAIGYSFIPGKPQVKVQVTPNPTLLALANQIGLDPNTLVRCMEVRFCGIDFKYSLVDSATGRELQNQPIHNIAGLGEATGNRPFRPLAKPMLFMPRSTIRIEVEEVSEGDLYVDAQLFIVLHGYKILGYGTTLP